MPLHRTYASQVERICLQCGHTFFTFPSEIARGGGRTCSRVCYHAHRSRSKADRFWAKVDQQHGPVHPALGRCWVWTGARKRKPWDYGTLGTPTPGDAPELAHRVSWELHHGPIPHGLNVLHRCDNPPCVNPAHLFLGSLRDNTRDMLAKGRHKVKLSTARIRELRERYAAGDVSQETLASLYGVGQSSVSRYLHKSL